MDTWTPYMRKTTTSPRWNRFVIEQAASAGSLTCRPALHGVHAEEHLVLSVALDRRGQGRRVVVLLAAAWPVAAPAPTPANESAVAKASHS